MSKRETRETEMTKTETAETTTREMTEAEALDEAVRLLTRRMSRLHPAAFYAVRNSLPDGVREAINAADARADKARARADLTWPTQEWIES
jgi:hypothetical protein